ncbi:TonB-dependent receptor [Neiella marina]|uniref:TonB-dependent receptor n=1 Tax=Neiella marina TaxID=508461 RepID=A0A8J2XP96_9GAMM|nr:TonB-dependent receptor [Neiella marina]GGA87156.1 TonB-dependent receptor [Neiella marina]
MFASNKLAAAVRFAVFGVAAASTVAVAPAIAAEETTEAKKGDAERIQVTGSRIKRTDLEATSPISVFDEESIQISGVNQIASFINRLPSAGVPGSTDTGTNFRTTTTGLNTVDLRNLGSERTLILVNGRRHIGGSAGSTTVDVSMIPVNLVERVEVVTGGAAAVYGSEAIAGVINFIMKDNFEGLQIDTRYGDSDLGGAEEKDISATVGGNFAGDKGNAVVYIGYSRKDPLYSRDRKMSEADAVNSSFGPKGNFLIGSGTPNAALITQDESTGLWDKPFVAAEDGFNRNGERIIRVPSERYQMNANITYDITDEMRFFTETSYNQLTSDSRLEPTITGEFISVGNSIPNIRIPLANPFVPDELRDAALVANPDAEEITMYRRFVELGPRTSDVQRKVFRTAFGLEGTIADTWDYEVYYQYGNFSQDQTNGGVFNTLNFYNALRVEEDGEGGYQCADDFARDLGCVPINVFGRGSIEGAALDWVSVDSQLTSRMEQEAIGAVISGPVFELPAGEVVMAVGYDWREEESKFNSDSLAQSGLTSGNTTPNTKGDYDVHEFFVEGIVPVLDGAPFADYLGFEFAARHSDYSTVGTNSTYKVGLDWRPTEDLMVRGSISTAVRAPSINDLFDPGSETFRDVVDPCALGGRGGTSATGETYEEQSAEVQANCATIPGTATLDPFAINIRSAGGLAAGNPDLEEEESDTKTFGFVYSPSQVEGLSMTVDYYKITVDDAINGFTAQTTADQCVRQSSFPSNPFCSLIERDPNTGLILRIDDKVINVATFEAEGVDFTIDYGMDFYGGDLMFNLIGNHSMTNDFEPFAGGEKVDSQGEIGAPDWKANFGTTYANGDYQVAWTMRYLDGVYVENDSKETYGTIGSYTYHDLNARYYFNDNFEFFAGVDNLFDKKPPFLGQGVPGDVTGTNTAADVYDAVRRYYYVGVTAKF